MKCYVLLNKSSSSILVTLYKAHLRKLKTTCVFSFFFRKAIESRTVLIKKTCKVHTKVLYCIIVFVCLFVFTIITEEGMKMILSV